MQQEMITEALENVITAIDQADVSEQEKMEARSLLQKLLRSKGSGQGVRGSGAIPRGEVFHAIEEVRSRLAHS